jgi:hypothetical protein
MCEWKGRRVVREQPFICVPGTESHEDHLYQKPELDQKPIRDAMRSMLVGICQRSRGRSSDLFARATPMRKERPTTPCHERQS